MDAAVQIVQHVLQQWGITGLVIVSGASFLGSAVAISRAATRFTKQTGAMIDGLKAVAAAQQIQHSMCDRHYDSAHQLADNMRAIAFELSRVGERIHENQMETNRLFISFLEKAAERKNAPNHSVKATD